jgi:hypothetical protein
MDCRDWLVARPEETGLREELAGSPLVAVLSTAIIESDDLRTVGAVLTLGLLDDGPAPPSDFDGGVALQLHDPEVDADDRVVRYLLPSPAGSLALLAEFTLGRAADPEASRRIQALMASFRWAA